MRFFYSGKSFTVLAILSALLASAENSMSTKSSFGSPALTGERARSHPQSLSIANTWLSSFQLSWRTGGT